MVGSIELDTRSQNILNILINASDYVNLTQIVTLLSVSKRSIYYDLNKINSLFKEMRIGEINIQRNKGLFLNENQKDVLNRYFKQSKLITYYQFSPNERISILLCALIGIDDILTIDQLMDYCHVSRNTVISDLKIAKNELSFYNLNLTSIRYTGYFVKGDLLKKRAVFFYHFNQICYLYKKNYLQFIKLNEVNNYIDRLKQIEKELETRYVEGTIQGLAVLLSFKDGKSSNLNFQGYDLKQIIITREFKITKKTFPELDRFESIYISLHLLGSRIQIIPEFQIESVQDKEIFQLAKNTINEFERIACIEFSQKEKVERAIFVHLKTSLYRYRYGIQIDNPLTKQISNNYPELFEVTRRVAKFIGHEIGAPLPESEIAYLTLHFGGHLEASKHKESVVKVVLFCQDGLSTVKLLQKEIEHLIKNIDIITISSIEELQNSNLSCDLVISTEELLMNCPVLRIHSILKEEDKTMLLAHLSRDYSLNLNQSVWDGVFKVISQYVSPNNIHKLKQDVFKYIHSRGFDQKASNIIMNPSMLDIITSNNIKIFQQEVSWQDSIRLSAQALLNESKITEQYIDNMLNNITNNGPYIYFEPGLAIAHSRPEDGVLQLGLSMGIFEKGVAFNKDLKANIILVLAPVDHETHLKLLKEIMDLFSTRKYFEEILKANDSQKVISIIDEGLSCYRCS